MKKHELRKAARDKACEARLPGVCSGLPETVVLAHIRRGNPGMGRKPSDLCGVRACAQCHAEIDMQIYRIPGLEGRIKTALQRTWLVYESEGLISVPDELWKEIFDPVKTLTETCRAIEEHAREIMRGDVSSVR